METLIAAYVAAWLGVVLYAARLGMHHRRLARRLEALEASADEDVRSAPKAA